MKMAQNRQAAMITICFNISYTMQRKTCTALHKSAIVLHSSNVVPIVVHKKSLPDADVPGVHPQSPKRPLQN